MEVKRKYHIDIIRILACFAVIFNHFDSGFFAFNFQRYSSISYWLLLALSVFCKFAVPAFFIISGALLLKKEESISILYKKRISKIALVLLVTSILYYIFERYVLGRTISISLLYTGETEYHLWYLYSYIALLISIPFLRSIAKDLSKSKIIYLTTIYITIRYITPIIELLFLNNNHRMNGYVSGMFTCADIFFLPLAGHYLENCHKDKINRNKLLAIWTINILTLLVAMYATGLTNTTLSEKIINQTYINFFSSTNAIVIFLTLKSINVEKIHNKLKKFILHLSSCTFGIYLIHLVFMRIINTRPEATLFYDLPSILQVIGWITISVIVLIISYAIVAIAKKIPLFKGLL